MIENIVRYIEAGEKPLQAALKGAQQNRLHPKSFIITSFLFYFH